MKLSLKFCLSVLLTLYSGYATAHAQRAELAVQTGHSGPISAIAFSPDRKTLASASWDITIKLWEVESGRELRTLNGHSLPANSVAFSRDGKMLASGSYDKTIKLWDVESGRELQTLNGHSEAVSSVTFSPDGKTLASGSGDKTIKLWEVASGREVRTLSGHSNWVSSVAFSPEGKTLASGSGDMSVKLWAVADGRELRTLSGHADRVYSIAFSPDGKTLASGSGDMSVKLWEVESGRELRTLRGHTDGVYSIAFSPDRRTLASRSGDNTIKLWEVASGRGLRTLNEDYKSVSSLTFSPDGKTLASGTDENTIKLWVVESGRELRTLAGHSALIYSLAFSPDGKTLASGSADKTIKLWELESGRELRTLTGHSNTVSSVAFSRDGKTLASGSYDNTIKLWEVASWRELRTLKGHAKWVDSVAFSPDGKTLASGSYDKAIKLWDVESGRELRTLNGHSSLADSIAFSADGKTLVSASENNTIKLWEVESGRELRTLSGHTNSVYSVAFSPDGKTLASGGEDKTIKLWDVASGRELLTLSGHFRSVSSVAFSPDGKSLASGSWDKSIKLWAVADGRELRTLSGHSSLADSVAFSPDGKKLVSACSDMRVKLWNVELGKELASLIAIDQNDWVVIDPAGRFDASDGAMKLMHFVVGLEPIALSQLKLRYYEPGLLQKIFKGEPLRDVSAFLDVRLTPDVQEIESSSQNPANTKRTIKLTNRGGGIGRVQVFVNEREFIADARDQKLKQDPEVKEALVTFDLTGASVIAGEKPNVKVVAWNYDPQAMDQYKGYISSRGTELPFAPVAARPAKKPELYAIIAGISDYAGDKLDLRFAAKDAEDIYRAINVGGKNLFGVERLHVTLLATGDNPQSIPPTKENFQKAFAAYAQQARPEDIFFAYLSGHGITLGRGSDTYLYLTKDANTTDTDLLQKDSDLLSRATINSDELREWFKSVTALKQVLILDTCAAGAVVVKLSSLSKDVQTEAIRAIDQMQDVTGFHVLMGSAADAVSYEATQYGQGLLTYSLLQGIKSGEALEEGGRIDVARLFQYAANKVPRMAQGIGGIQRPEIRSPSGDSKSFALGLISSVADKKEIPLETPKPLILRPVLLNQKLGRDDLKLTPLLRDALREESYATVRGRDAAPLVFVDAEEMPDAIIPTGLYTIEGETVRVTLNLVRNDEVVKSFTLVGRRTDLPGLVKQLVADFTAAARQ
jgi:WD40 repeat protein